VANAGVSPYKPRMTAIVFVSGFAADGRSRLAGLAPLRRALIVAARAGVRRCLVAGAPPGLAHDPRFPRLTPVADAADARAVLHSEGIADGAMILCLSADVVTTPAALRSFAAAESGTAVLALGSIPVARVACGALEDVWPALAQPGSAALDHLAPAGGIAFTHLPESSFTWVRSRQQAAEVERQLLLALENPRDGRLDTLLNRRLSRPLTRLLLRLPLTPNQVTVLSFLTGLLAAWSFAGGSYSAGLFGALLFQLAAVLDCCDGEVARVKFAESSFGDALDITLDAIANLALFAGIARGAWVAGELPDAPWVAWGIGIGILFTFPVVTWAERALPEPASSREHRLVQRLVASLSTRDFSAIVFAAALTGTLPWFLRGAAIGANVFWVLLLVLLVRGRAARQP
jgi:phosphatidylglycerophosphate synthase